MIDYWLILATPTLVGLYVLWKTIRLHRHPPQVVTTHKLIYVCPHCNRTHMDRTASLTCCYRLSGDEIVNEDQKTISTLDNRLLELS